MNTALLRAFAALASMSAPAQAQAAQAAPEWRYVAPEPVDWNQAPAPVALFLTDEIPENLELAADLAGFEPRFAELHYGDEDARRVALVLLHEPAGLALFADTDRSRSIELGERLAGAGPRWTAAIRVSAAEAGAARPARTVGFSIGPTGMVLAASTLGSLAGEVELAGRMAAARRMDGDCNGFFGDGADRLLVDIDADGAFEPFVEGLPCRPIVSIGGTRYALRSDRLGNALGFEPVVGSGTIRLRIGAAAGGELDVRTFEALLGGRDGTAIGVRAHDEPVEVPVGEYRLRMLDLGVVDSEGRAWSYTLSAAGDLEPSWHAVAAGQELVIDPLGWFDIALKPARLESGELSVGAVLFTSTGLRVNAMGSSVDRRFPGSRRAQVRLLDPDGALFAMASSGFA